MAKANVARRIRRSAEQWSRLIEEQAASGLSRHAFCETQGLAPSSFAKALARRRLPSSVKRTSEVRDFVPVTLESTSTERWEFEMQLGASLLIRVRGM